MSPPAALLAVLVFTALGALSGFAAPGRAGSCPRPSFDRTSTIVETGSPEESADPCWWLNSGALFTIGGGIGRTVQGELSETSEWHRRYARANPVDTDGGVHPQNLFRLVTRDRWRDLRQEVFVRIRRVHPSRSPERGEWSGVLLFGRYLDGDNLYYAGLRLDGAAVVKKKRDGRYTTLGYEPLYRSPAGGRSSGPELLPLDRPIGLRLVVTDRDERSVRLALFVNQSGADDGWTRVLEVIDDGRTGGAAVRGAGHAGLRTDFMDVEFSAYRLEEIGQGAGSS